MFSFYTVKCPWSCGDTEEMPLNSPHDTHWRCFAKQHLNCEVSWDLCVSSVCWSTFLSPRLQNVSCWRRRVRDSACSQFSQGDVWRRSSSFKHWPVQFCRVCRERIEERKRGGRVLAANFSLLPSWLISSWLWNRWNSLLVYTLCNGRE